MSEKTEHLTLNEVVVFDAICKTLNSDANTVASVLMSMPNNDSDAVLELILNAKNEDTINEGVVIFNNAKEALGL